MRKFIGEFWPFFIIIFICVSLFTGMYLKQALAEKYVLTSLVYDHAEPENEWKSHDYAVFTNARGEKIKYMCPEYIYKALVPGSTYDITIIDGDFSLPSIKVWAFRPSN